ncbi:MBL fold metallo-hydrolase [Litorisediminicola beolgyonensis]|uniref:MBL fold metallo-hydrolase n=1 Tax=Litorisediminicola beolgyonensis TaxID=1173614 RepID=A0ABW3ZEH6_9RHOB
MTPTRRQLLTIAAAMPALSLPATRVSADLAAPEAANPGHVRFTLGEARITILTDGHLELPADGLGINADPEEVRAFLTSYFLSPETNYAHTNHVVIELGETRLLVDAGSGSRFLPTAGRLMRSLDEAGIDPNSLTHLFITHAHPDHIWGIRDDFDEAILPGAAKIVGAAEHAFWTEDGLAASMPTEMQQMVVGAQNSLTVEGADWQLVSDGAELAPGIRAIDTPGHTPGHMSLVVESGDQQLLVTGDALNHAYMNFAHPGWVNGFDMDADQTVATRQSLLDMAASDRMAVLGYHFPFPGIGHVMRMGEAYAFVPATWRWQ